MSVTGVVSATAAAASAVVMGDAPEASSSRFSSARLRTGGSAVGGGVVFGVLLAMMVCPVVPTGTGRDAGPDSKDESVGAGVALTVTSVDRTSTDRSDAAGSTRPVNRRGAPGNGATDRVRNMIGEPAEGREAVCPFGGATTHMCNDAATAMRPSARPSRGRYRSRRHRGLDGSGNCRGDTAGGRLISRVTTAWARPPSAIAIGAPGCGRPKRRAVRCVLPNQSNQLPNSGSWAAREA